MSLKRRGLAKDVEEMAEDGDEDAKALVKESRVKSIATQNKMPVSVAWQMERKHFDPIIARWKLILPIEEQGVGRPTTYNPEYCALVLEALAVPMFVSERGLSARLGVYWGTWQGWKERNPEFASTIDLGLQIQQDQLSNVGVYDRVNVAGLIMAMKNSSHRWRDKIEHDIGENIGALIREVEQKRKPVQWQDLGAQNVKPASMGDRPDVIDAVVTESVPDGSGGEDA